MFRQRFFLLLILSICFSSSAARFNAVGLEFKTVNTEHFRITYVHYLGHLVERVGNKFEELYKIYTDTYGLVLRTKTDVIILDSDYSNGWALPYTNTITLWSHDLDFNLRGTHDWWEDVITHEFAHVVSTQAGLKLPPAIPDIRFGFFSHPNEKNRTEIFHSFNTSNLPFWLSEGIAQYESSRHGADRWDSHRDMILRTLTLSDNLLSWAHMQVATGRGDDYEKAYNHGFALVSYISEKYGYNKVTLLLRESAKINRLDFDRAIKNVLGISGKQLYNEWKTYLEKKYKQQISEIGTQVYGKKLNKDGYDNFWPKYSPDGSKLYFLSNGKNDYSRKTLYIYSFSDTIDEKKKIRPAMAIDGNYDISESGHISFSNAHSSKSQLAARQGGYRTLDLFIDSLRPDKISMGPYRKTKHQLTQKKSVFSSAFSPSGDRIVCAQRSFDKFFLAITDTSGKKYQVVFPQKSDSIEIAFIFSLDWSSDGRKIAFSFIDKNNRKVAVYDTTDKSCKIICSSKFDQRDPSFSPDGKYLYFSSNRSGIFNIYRYHFDSSKLEQITNVSGGAFTPSLSPDGKKLVYAGYDKDGYSIYQIDTIQVHSSTDQENAITSFTQYPLTPKTISGTPQKALRGLPRQLLVMPILFGEQAVAKENNVNKGNTILKTGIVFNLIDPWTLSDMGSELNGYLFIQPEHILEMLTFQKGFFDVKRNYDLGLFGSTKLFPFTLSADYTMRGIASRDWFFNENEEETEYTYYSAQIQDLMLGISHAKGSGNNQMALHIFGGMDLYDIRLLLDGVTVFKYNLNKGFRIGAMSTIASIKPEAKSDISPIGFAAKLQYDFWDQHALKEENSFSVDDGTLKERYDDYKYHQVLCHTKMGITAPWYMRHDIHLDLMGTALKIIKQDTPLPSFLMPVGWVPGYSYYYRDTKIKRITNNDTVTIEHDTAQICGKAVIQGELSYRFPLWPKKLIDKKLGVVYLERLYGAFNISGGAGWDSPSDFFDFSREDWLISYGFELRLQGQTFNNLPLAVKLRWDKGVDQKEPRGGNRFTFSVGYDFDNWGVILLPDYKTKNVFR